VGRLIRSSFTGPQIFLVAATVGGSENGRFATHRNQRVVPARVGALSTTTMFIPQKLPKPAVEIFSASVTY
jgi:hypothetical protein